MGKRNKRHIPGLPAMLMRYCKKRSLDFHQYSPYHMRLMDGGYVVLDTWTTGKYYVLATDYVLIHQGIVERGGEKGEVPTNERHLSAWLDKLFFPEGVE